MREMMKSKIHRATVTDANLDYEGSITIDQDLLDLADIIPFEKVQVVNINSGARFETYAITGERGSGTICLNGAAARLVQPKDLVIIITYSQMDNVAARAYVPKVVLVDRKNRPIAQSH
ncbi:MAG: aspartate 1-decarboxylase [Peptococcaceae bacterium]|nr:aspartate 1-decarboxylase [Peptococcaceae bacterium]